MPQFVLNKTLNGHSGNVRSVAFSPDGTRVVSGSADKTIKIWSATTGEVVQTLDGHSDTVKSVAFSPDGTRVVSGSYDKTVKIWQNDAMQLAHIAIGQDLPPGLTEMVASYLGASTFDQDRHFKSVSRLNRKSRKGSSRSPSKTKPRSRSTNSNRSKSQLRKYKSI